MQSQVFVCSQKRMKRRRKTMKHVEADHLLLLLKQTNTNKEVEMITLMLTTDQNMLPRHIKLHTHPPPFGVFGFFGFVLLFFWVFL